VKHWHIWLPFLVGQFGFDFGGPGTFFGDVLAFIEGELSAALSFLYSLLVSVANFLLGIDEFIFGFTDTIFKDIKKIWKTIWDGLSKITLAKIIDAIGKIRKTIATIIGKILCYFQAVRDILDYIFNKFVVPYLNMIRHLRQTLQIFRLLGFKWAARLDARLALIENRIVQAYELLRINLNRVISWAQLITDPFGILRRNPALAAVLRTAPEIKNAIDRATNHARTQKEQDSANHDNGWYQKSAAAGNAAYFKGGAQPQYLRDAHADFASAVKELPSLASQGLPTGNDGL
jgi:hypothetical protein